MLISITDFAESRGKDRDTVNAYIRNHQEISNETVKRGRCRYIDTESIAFQLLEEKYPLPKPVEVIEDAEARRQLMEAQQLIIQLQQTLVEAAPKIAWAEHNQNLLDTLSEENEELKAENKAINQKYEKLMNETIQELKALDSLRRDQSWHYTKETLWEEAKGKYQRDLADYANALGNYKRKLEEAEKKLQEEKNKTWWDKLLGR